MEEFDETEIATLPRWLQIPVGLVICVFLLPCLAGSVALAVSANERAPIMAPLLGSAMALTCVWLFAMSVKIILGKKKRGGLMGPLALRLSAWFFVLIPATSILTGAFFEHPVRYGMMSVAYLYFFFGLRSLSYQRERQSAAESALADGFKPPLS